MADITGPISTLPGALHNLPSGKRCDNHPDRLAIKRVQGETDSFGCEMLDLCQECYDEIKNYLKSERDGQCDWCKAEARDLRDYRDIDEGMYGPVYRVCGECRKKDYQRIKDELDESQVD